MSAREKRVERDDLMARTRAARAYTNQCTIDAGVEMAGFLALFHPDMPQEQVLKLMRAAREKQRQGR